MEKNWVYYVYFLFMICGVFTKFRIGHGFVIQKDFIHIREVNSSHPDELYPERMCVALHKPSDGSKHPFLQLKLDKHLDTDDAEDTRRRETLFDIHEKKPPVPRYRVNGGHKLVKMHRTVDDKDFLLNGKFCADGNLVILRPLEEDWKIPSSDNKGVIHYITFHDPTESESECVYGDADESEEYDPNDYTDTDFDGTMSEEHMELVEDLFDTDADTTINDGVESKAVRYALSSAFSGKSVPHGHDRVRRAQHLTIELLMVIDYAAYSWWESVVEDPTDTTNTTDAMSLIRQFYAFVFQGIDARFMSIDTQPYMIDLAFSGLFVAKTEEESYWTTESVIGENVDSARVMVNSSDALDKFQKWLDKADFLPSYDHAILFTGTNLSYAGSPGNTGLAFESSMCRNISNSSIVEDMFDFRTITFSTQQIARSLGSRDDMDNNNCLEFFNHIMAPKFKLPIRSFVSNRWTFSSCSEQYFFEYTSELSELGLTCLTDQAGVERYPPDLAKLVEYLPGKVYSGKKQCENRFGLQSDICRENIGTSYADICAGLSCTLPGLDHCDYILPADGTPCGNKKYCWHGSCLEFEDAVASSDTCVFGNDPNSNCESITLKDRARCYNESVRYKCCETCEALFTGLLECEYGDRSGDCSMSGCVNGDDTYKTSTCCLTCSDGPTPYSPPSDAGVTDIFPLQNTPVPLNDGVSETSTAQSATDITPSSILHAISSLAALVQASVGDTPTTDVFDENMVATTEGFHGNYGEYNTYDENGDYSVMRSRSRGVNRDTNQHMISVENINGDGGARNGHTAYGGRCVCASSSNTRPSGRYMPCVPAKLTGGNGSLYDRIFFKDLARSMQNNQRYIRRNLRKNVQALFRSVTMKIRGGNYEYETENESGREGGEDESLNRKLLPIWRQHYHEMMNGIERSVREMRYRVLALLNRHFKYRNYRHW